MATRLLIEKGKHIKVYTTNDSASVQVFDESSGKWRAAMWSDAYQNAVSSGTMADGEITTRGSKVPKLGHYILEFGNNSRGITSYVHPGNVVSYIEGETVTNEGKDIEVPIWEKQGIDEDFEFRDS